MNFLAWMNRRGAETQRVFFRSAFLRLCGLLFLLQAGAHAQRLSPLAPAPDWSQLDAFQETITRDEFERLLNDIYAPNEAAKDFIEIKADVALIKEKVTPPTWFELRFASSAEKGKPVPRTWKPASALPKKQTGRPLAGLKVAIDPGHLGGDWAKMEARWFQIGNSLPVTEGDMTLRVAKILTQKLRTLGADVSLVRESSVPTTGRRPTDLLRVAEKEIRKSEKPSAPRPPDAAGKSAVELEAERLFYRVSEIRARALLVNRTIQPDLILCLHFNAEPWGDPAKPSLVEANHLHLLVNGCYSTAELSHDDVRLDMLLKLLGRGSDEEIAVSKVVANAMAAATGLPPYRYNTNNAQAIAGSPCLWARNLLANRLYRCPVVYIEPFVMNSKTVFNRVQMGDYDGLRDVDGVMRKSIYREYADAVADGLVEYYGTRSQR